MKDDYFCPKPNAWHNIFNDLIEGYEESTGKKLPKGVQAIREAGGPPTPLVLGAWLGHRLSSKSCQMARNY